MLNEIKENKFIDFHVFLTFTFEERKGSALVRLIPAYIHGMTWDNDI